MFRQLNLILLLPKQHCCAYGQSSMIISFSNSVASKFPQVTWHHWLQILPLYYIEEWIVFTLPIQKSFVNVFCIATRVLWNFKQMQVKLQNSPMIALQRKSLLVTKTPIFLEVEAGFKFGFFYVINFSKETCFNLIMYVVPLIKGIFRFPFC